MPNNNKSVLEAANQAIRSGDIEGFLAYCTDDLEWTIVGDETLKGKGAVRRWMQTAYADPPKFTVADMIAQDDLVVAMGDIAAAGDQGRKTPSAYCDVWRFRDGKMAELRAFVIEPAGAA